MIPGGYEKTRRYNLQVDDFDEYDDDDDDEFILDSAYQSTAAEKQQPTGWQQTEISEMEKNINEDNSLADNNNNIPDDHIKTTTKSSFFFNDQNDYINTANKLDDSINVIDELKSAIVCKNLAQVKSLMEMHDIDVNCLFKSTNWTPIMLAANSGAFELVEYFVRHEANVNFEHDSYNVLMCACGSPNGNEYNQVKIVDLLLNKGVDVNSCDKYEQTPLMYACRAQNFFLVDLLVKHGAKIDAQDDNGWTPLSHASYNGCLKSVKKLLRHGADPIIHTIDYLYPFDLAKKNGHTEIYQLLKNYLRMRRIEESKSNNNVLYELLDEFEDQDDGLANDRKIAEDLETFLRGLGLKNVLSLLKAHRISLKTLLNCKVDDLKKIGIKDDDNCKLIVGEIKKFHQKNWQSSALAEVNSDVNLNCIEAISIMSNLSRQIDFMASNVKYVQISGVQENKELFADEFSSVKLKNECKLAMSNCKDLMTNLNSLNSIVQANVKKDKADRIDEVPAIQSYGTTNWLKITPIKAVAFSTAAFMISSIFIVKIKRTF